jgi:hypothetical protein
MKVRALGELSGTVGDRAVGEEFTTDATTGRSLIDRGLVEEIKDEASPAPKATKEKE